MNQFVTAADVRTFANISGTTGRYSDASISSNIMTAQGFLQRESSRLFEKRDATTLKFTTEGRAQFAIPDLRTATTVTWDGTVNRGHRLLAHPRREAVRRLRGDPASRLRQGGPVVLLEP